MSAVLVPKATFPKESSEPSVSCLPTAVVSEVTTWYSMLMPVAGSVSCVRSWETLRRSSISLRSSAIQVAVLPVSLVEISSRHSFITVMACSSPRARACMYSPWLRYAAPMAAGAGFAPILLISALMPRCSSCMDWIRSISSLLFSMVSFLCSTAGAADLVIFAFW